MRQNKRAIVGLSTFSLLIFMLILILVSTYYFSDKYTIQNRNFIAKSELDNSLFSLRSSLIDIVSNNNSYLIYQNNYDISKIKINLNDKYISGTIDRGYSYAKTNISSLGLEFCSSYQISPKAKTKFYFNGSCISIIN